MEVRLYSVEWADLRLVSYLTRCVDVRLASGGRVHGVDAVFLCRGYLRLVSSVV